MHLVFIGTGYVGLVSGVMMAHLGHHIICLDSDESKIESLKQGIVPIYEPGLDEYIKNSKKRLQFISQYRDAEFHPDAVFICVGTPQKESGEANLEYVFEAALDSAKNFENVPIVIKSTVPPGTAHAVEAKLRKEGYKNAVISNPEFLSEGRAIDDFLYPDRIIVGADDEKSKELMESIYQSFSNENYSVLCSTRVSAELIKYASNSFLATKIAFINEMADLCEKTSANIEEVSSGIGADKRIGKDFLKTGPGFGGSCFPKDIMALQAICRKYKSESKILDATIESNKFRTENMVEKIREGLGGGLCGAMLGVLGLTFKAGTDDVRSSPALEIIRLLIEEGVYICAYDPKGMDNAKKELQVDMAKSYRACAMGAYALVILTEWDEFKNLDYESLAMDMGRKIIFDFRNIIDVQEAEKHGFKVFQLGKVKAT